MNDLNNEGDSFSKLGGLIKSAGYSKPVNIELAKVVKSPPDLQIELDSDGLVLHKEDLIVAENLTNHKRRVRIESSNISGSTTSNGEGPHSHGYDSIDMRESILTFENELEVGERLIVACLDEDMVYVIIDRARWY